MNRLGEAALTLSVDVDTVRVVSALRDVGVEPILLKGPVLAGLLYSGNELRPYCDIDLMVAPDDLARAEATLRAVGYLPDPPPLPPEPLRHSVTWSHPGRREVDLHQRLHFVDVAYDRVWDVVRRDAARIDVAGTPVLAPCLAVLALHLALHAAASAHRVPKTLTDLERGLARLPRQAWVDAMAVAAELDAVNAFGGGLALCPAGVRIGEELGLPGAGTTTMHLWRSTREYARPWTIQLLVDQPSLRAAAVAIGRRCFPPAAHIRTPGGRRGRLWLVVGYASRLASIAIRVPASVLAWLRFSWRAKRRAQGPGHPL